jgi:O-antigen/teichoic acid export membrane protein
VSALGERFARVRQSRLVRQNLILFAGGLIAGVGGFVYHAIAGRVLGPSLYGEVASLVALYAVLNTPTFILILVLARYAAHLQADNNAGAIRHILTRATEVTAIPCLAAIVVMALLSKPIANYLNIPSSVSLLGLPISIPVIWLGAAAAAVWQVAMPRGVLQGIQHFPALSLNLSMEMLVRTGTLALLLALGFSVAGSMVALVAGCAFSYSIGILALRELARYAPVRVPLRAMAGFSLTAAAGTLGILLLYNADVILAKHYLDPHGAGIYGGLNKIGTILYFLTLSVSQVLFPRVVEAIAHESHPGRLLLLSAGIMCALGVCALAVFAVVPGLVVRILFGPSFSDASGYILAVGVIGLAISLDNLLVQFFMAAHDRVFMPLLGVFCALEVALIAIFHANVGQVVVDVLIAVLSLLAVLTVRAWMLMPHLHPESLREAA